MGDGTGRDQRTLVAARVRSLLYGDEEESTAADPRQAVDTGPVAPGRLPARHRIRLDPGRRGAIALGVAALVAAVITCWWVFAARPTSMAVDPAAIRSTPPVSSSGAGLTSDPGRSVAGSSAGGAAAPSSAGVVVDVVGKVRHPGVYRLAADARVEDAIAAAGGVRPGFDTATLNLAARVSDGQLVAVGVAAAAPAGGASEPAGTGPSTGAAAGPVYLNSATLEQLDGLPGVGPVLAQHILDYRTQHGSFTSVDQLKDVSGIGPAKYAGLKDLVSV